MNELGEAAGNTLTINGAVHTYDQKNQLTSLSGLDSSGAWVTVNYRYDPMGRRISSSLNNQTTLYAYDGWNVVEEYQLQPSSFILQTLHTWGLDLSGTIQGAGGVGGLLYTEDLSSSTAWHHHYDGNGNVTHLTDASATSIASYTYDAFGNTETATGSAATTNKYRFSTKPIDETIPSNPLYYYGYRFYNPLTGRWLNRDPIEEKGGLNLYGFVGNENINAVDNLGLIGAITCEELALSAWNWGEKAVVSIHCGATTLGGRAVISVGGGIVAVLACTCGTAGNGSELSWDPPLPKVEERDIVECELYRRKRGCRPCTPPKGTILYEIVPPYDRKTGRHSRPPYNTGHVKLWIANQTTYPGCECKWNKNKPFSLDFTQTPPPYLHVTSGTPDTVKITGGGPY